MLALAFMIFFAENIIHVFKLFLVVFFITSTVQIILDDTYSRPFFIDAPHLLGSSTSKISIHTSNIYFLAVYYRHLFFCVCVETWLMQESEKRASTDVFVCIICACAFAPSIYTHDSKACFTVHFVPLLGTKCIASVIHCFFLTKYTTNHLQANICSFP